MDSTNINTEAVHRNLWLCFWRRHYYNQSLLMHAAMFVSAQAAYKVYGFYCEFGIYPHQLGCLGGLGFSGGRWLGAEVIDRFDNNNRQDNR